MFGQGSELASRKHNKLTSFFVQFLDQLKVLRKKNLWIFSEKSVTLERKCLFWIFKSVHHFHTITFICLTWKAQSFQLTNWNAVSENFFIGCMWIWKINTLLFVVFVWFFFCIASINYSFNYMSIASIHPSIHSYSVLILLSIMLCISVCYLHASMCVFMCICVCVHVHVGMHAWERIMCVQVCVCMFSYWPPAMLTTLI